MFAILNWTEVWATLFPILVWIFKKPNQYFFAPIKIYLCIAVVLNFWANLAYFDLIESNYYIYSINAVCRIFFFFWFFSLIKIPANNKISLIVYAATAILIVLNFIFLEDFFTAFSSKTFAFEGIVLMIFCILYFLRKLKSDEISADFDASLYIVTGLAIYEAVCFPVFLFFKTLIESNEKYAGMVWDVVHNILYIVLCLFIARAFYGNITRRTNN